MKETFKEVFKDYEVSNLGNVRSFKNNKVRVLKQSVNANYLRVSIMIDKKPKQFHVHILMAIAFLGYTPNGNKIVVDHIDNNPLNNTLENLQIITHRQNVSKDMTGSSKYTGVSFVKSRNKWLAQIQINGIAKNLGRFINEIDASNAYQKALIQSK